MSAEIYDWLTELRDSDPAAATATVQALAALAAADDYLGLPLPPGMGLLGLGRVVADLEAILGARVDLVPASDLKPAVRERAERELVTL